MLVYLDVLLEEVVNCNPDGTWCHKLYRQKLANTCAWNKNILLISYNLPLNIPSIMSLYICYSQRVLIYGYIVSCYIDILSLDISIYCLLIYRYIVSWYIDILSLLIFLIYCLLITLLIRCILTYLDICVSWFGFSLDILKFGQIHLI
jgi:hypothetical protein